MREPQPEDVKAVSAGPSSASPPPQQSSTSPSNAAHLTRVRDNQRRSRARRKEYLQELEEKFRKCEQVGVEASHEIQLAAKRVLDENQRLRAFLRSKGIDDREIETYDIGVSSASTDHLGTVDSRSPGAAQSLESLLGQRRVCCPDLPIGSTCTPQTSYVPSRNLSGHAVGLDSASDMPIAAFTGSDPSSISSVRSSAYTPTLLRDHLGAAPSPSSECNTQFYPDYGYNMVSTPNSSTQLDRRGQLVESPSQVPINMMAHNQNPDFSQGPYFTGTTSRVDVLPAVTQEQAIRSFHPLDNVHVHPDNQVGIVWRQHDEHELQYAGSTASALENSNPS